MQQLSEQQLVNAKVEFICILCVLFFYYFVIWNPKANSMATNVTFLSKVWDCRQLLKLIPVSLIIDEKQLYEQFNNKELFEKFN